MGFSLISSLLAGFLATVMMSLLLEVASFKGTTSMPTMPLVLGSVVSGNHELAMLIGSALHFVVVGSVIFGSAYGLLFAILDGVSWWFAILVGVLHGTLIGVGLGFLGKVHPRMVDRSAFRGNGPVAIRGPDDVVLVDPEVFGVGWGDRTPVVLVASYALYGLMFALVYSQLA